MLDEGAPLKPKQVSFQKPLTQVLKPGNTNKKERQSIKALILQNNKENTSENITLNTSSIANTTINTTINSTNTSLNTTTSLKPKAQSTTPHEPRKRQSIMSFDSLYPQTKAQHIATPTSTSLLMKNTPTIDKFNTSYSRKMTKPKPSSPSFHPYLKHNSSNTPRSLAARHHEETSLEKQEKGFEKWLNFVFSPYYDDDDPLKTTDVIAGPSLVSYRELACQRRQSLLRLDVVRLMNSEEHERMMGKVETVMSCFVFFVLHFFYCVRK